MAGRRRRRVRRGRAGGALLCRGGSRAAPPHHAAPLAMQPPPHHAARPHRAAPCQAAPLTAPPLTMLPTPCQASYKLSKELHDTHKSCTEHWVNMATQACAGGGLHQVRLVSMGQTHISLHLPRSPCTCLHLPIPHQVGHISMGQIHLLVLCKPHLADSISEVETGSVSLGGRVQPDRHCNLQPHAPQPAPRLVTACTLRRCRRVWAAWARTRAGSPSPSACARRTCASSTRTSPRTRARTTCQA